ncbi:SGNH hydrolase superfamily [Sesbania bispinosa]|nr:SGNH hydrolase superfamily [Sesbania bispinosa]
MASESKTWLVLSLLLLAAASCVHGESQVPCLFIFGDSLSDDGNNNNLSTSSKANFKPYGIDFPIGPTGRYTNNRTAVDIITLLLGFEKFIPPFANTSDSDILKGVNYASGGSGIRNETGMNLGEHISLGLQIENHKVIISQIAARFGGVNKAIEYLNKCLYYVNIGTNDYENNYFLPNLYPTSHIYSPEQYAEVLTVQLDQYLKDMHEIGARKFVLNGLSPIGCNPFEISTHGTNGSCYEEGNAAVFIFNDKLKSLVNQSNIEFSADSKFIFVNYTAIFATFDKSHGFTVTNTPCCPTSDGFCIRDETPCQNRNEYVYYDGIHSSDAANRITAIGSYNASNPNYTYPMDIKQLVQS